MAKGTNKRKPQPSKEGKEVQIVEANITDLKFDDKNFNLGSSYGNHLMQESFEKFGAGRSILIDKDNNIIAGNKSTEKFGEQGGQKVIIVETDGNTLVAVKRTDISLNSPEGRELALADNATAKANIVFAHDLISEVIGTEVAEHWGVVEVEKGIEPPVDNQNYTRKIEAPTYEVKNEKPDPALLVDRQKANDLIQRINESNIPKVDKDFLKLAAFRHLVFDYGSIADYYAHSSKEVQELMEENALVIIDFNKAIEHGFVKLSEEIAEQYKNEYGDEE